MSKFDIKDANDFREAIVGITNLLLVHYVIYCIRPFFILAIIYFCVKLYVFICDKMKCAWLKNFIGAR